MRIIRIPEKLIAAAMAGPIQGTCVQLPVAVDWSELQLTEGQIWANAIAKAWGKEQPYPDHSIFLLEMPYIL